MGGSKTYQPEGGFSEQTFEKIGTTENGIKIIGKVGGGSAKTPMYSNTPNTEYAILDNTGRVKQISVYGGKDGRQKIKDIDIGHSHTNKTNKKSFGENEIHVHEYKDGVRSQTARKPSASERRKLMIARRKKYK